MAKCFYHSFVLILATTLVSQINGQCPDARDFAPCTCDGEGFNCRLALDHKDLEHSFKTYSDISMARTLFLQGTHVNKLTTGIFGKYAIQALYLDLNNITVVESGAFKGSEELATVISLYSNNIKEFPFQDMSQFTQLETLNLAKNQLTSIPENAFGASSSLTQVILSDNKISNIGAGAFEMLESLQNLELSSNRIGTLGPNSMALTTKRLEQLSFAYNNVQVIDPTAFSNQLPKFLLLNNNNITTVPEKYYSGLVSRMSKLEAYISLQGNRMTCVGCSFKWIFENDDAFDVFAGFRCEDGRDLEDLTSRNIGCIE